ncbi:MAG: ABC transporter ATP-binding protein [Anaerolineae bacterium]|nr:ABC transporter ATP-binding protein [Anaerolineae bacterium]
MIKVTNLNFTYPKMQQAALHDLNFEIKTGEIFGFLGPSGAGKSTTQKILIGLLNGFSGSVEIMGKAVATWGSDYYERIGVSFEQPNHFLKLTALENLNYFAALYARPALNPLDLLRRVGLEEDAHLQVGQFSKGMKNRLTVARSLLNDPDLLFLDEPTSGLDPVNARIIKELIQQQKEAGKTVFLTTHNMAVADELCDRVAFLVDGDIRLIDTPRSLKLQYGRRVVRAEYHSNSHMQQQDFEMDGLGRNRQFIDLLQTGSLETLHTQEATLEDIFIRVTGRSLT